MNTKLWTKKDARLAAKDGWRVSECSGIITYSGDHLDRFKGSPIFAVDHVLAQAYAGSELHRKALRASLLHNHTT